MFVLALKEQILRSQLRVTVKVKRSRLFLQKQRASLKEEDFRQLDISEQPSTCRLFQGATQSFLA